MNIPFDYTIRRSSKAKRIGITIKKAKVVLVIPEGRIFGEKEGIKFLYNKKDWVLKNLAALEVKTDNNFDNMLSLPEEEIGDYENYKEPARKLVHAKVKYWNQFYSFEYGDIRIKRLKTRWGSCSSLGNLNFNYRVYFLPEEYQDYLIVHELCHLKEMNHGPRFWALMEEAIPESRMLGKVLRKVG